jgi:hypothetical protein
MLTFLDLLKTAHGGNAFDSIAKAYGLKPGEVETMATAFLPMFQFGLLRSMRQAAAPETLADLLDPSKFGAAFEDAHAAASPPAREAGRMALERVFGSKDAARVAADQAAEISGVGADVVSKVMPTLAATLLGGLGKSIEDTPMAAMLKAWSGGVDPSADPMAAMTAPYRDAMNAFLKGYAEGKPKPEPEPGTWPEGLDAFGKMFDAGVEITEKNRKAFEKIFGKPD